MNLVQVSPVNPHAMNIDLPFEAHRAVFVTFQAGHNEKNLTEREKLIPEAQTIWDELATLSVVARLTFSPRSLMMELSPACDAIEAAPYLERYFTQRLGGAGVSSGAAKKILDDCAFALLARRRIVVERSPLGESVTFWFRRRIFDGSFGGMSKARGRSPFKAPKKQVAPGELYDALREALRIDGVRHILLEPHSVTVERHPNYSIERSIDGILALVQAALYGKSDCEVRLIEPYRPTKEELRQAKNYGGYRDRS